MAYGVGFQVNRRIEEDISITKYFTRGVFAEDGVFYDEINASKEYVKPQTRLVDIIYMLDDKYFSLNWKYNNNTKIILKNRNLEVPSNNQTIQENLLNKCPIITFKELTNKYASSIALRHIANKIINNKEETQVKVLEVYKIITHDNQVLLEFKKNWGF